MKAIKTTTVSVPKSLAEKIKKRLKKAGFDSKEVFSAKEEKKVKERLKSLGYLE